MEVPSYIFILRKKESKEILRAIDYPGYPFFGMKEEFPNPFIDYDVEKGILYEYGEDPTNIWEIPSEMIVICVKKETKRKLMEKFPNHQSLLDVITNNCEIVEDQEGYWYTGKIPFDVVGGIEGRQPGDTVDIILKKWEKPSFALVRDFKEKDTNT